MEAAPQHGIVVPPMYSAKSRVSDCRAQPTGSRSCRLLDADQRSLESVGVLWEVDVSPSVMGGIGHMRSVVLRNVDAGPELEDVAVSDPGPGEAVVRLTASGICGTELHILAGHLPSSLLPMVMGHEGAGVVEAVGEGVLNVAVGDPVVVTSTAPCRRCKFCLLGRTYQCIQSQKGPYGARLHTERGDVTPFASIGSMAEFSVVAAGQLVPVPSDVPLDIMALTGCGVLTGVGAVLNAAPPSPGDSALVVGCGGVGLNVIQACRLAGARTIIAVDPSGPRRDLAEAFGATHVIDPTHVSIEEGVRQIVPIGVDFSYEVVGSTELLSQALMALRPGGICTMVGVPDNTTISIPAVALLPGERRLQGCNMGSSSAHRDIPKIIDLYKSGRLMLDELVGDRVDINAFEKGFESARRGEVARCLITF
jgi:S-(hydroxymethyl)glutathione dehydrogenase/alcohol dehydrogenase